MNDLRSLEGLSRLLIERTNSNINDNINDSPTNDLLPLTLFQRSKTTSSQTSAASSRLNTQTKIPMLLNCDSLKKILLKRTISTTNGKNAICDTSNDSDGKNIKNDNEYTFNQNSNSIQSSNKDTEGFSHINLIMTDIEKLSMSFNENHQSSSTKMQNNQNNGQDYCDEKREVDNLCCADYELKNINQDRDGPVVTEQDQNLSLLQSCAQTSYLMQYVYNKTVDNIDNYEIDELGKNCIDANSNTNNDNGLSLTLDNIEDENVDTLKSIVDNDSMNNSPQIIDTADSTFNHFLQKTYNDTDNEEHKQNSNNYNEKCSNCEEENEDDGLQFVLDEISDNDDDIDLDYSDNGMDKNNNLDTFEIKNNNCSLNTNNDGSKQNEAKSQIHPVLSLMDMYSSNTKNVLMNIGYFPNEEFAYFPTVSKSSSNIGTGTSGIVTKAFHLKSCNIVAIKICRSLSGYDIVNFQREAALYQKFAHIPEITGCLGFGRDNENHLCMALEYMNMGSLSNLTSGSMTEKHAKYIAKSILLALRSLHYEFYVHNDIKPSNILINKRGDVKLSDFGCVKQMINKDSPLSHVVGSKHYFSPEKWLHPPPIQYTTKSDIWSLGITLYELLTNIGNENRNNNAEHSANNSSNNDDGYTTSPTLNPAIFSSSACDFISQCLIQDSAKRPSCEELLKHEWLSNASRISFETNDENNNNAENENDLLFMIHSLIQHYSQKNFLENTSILSNSNNNNDSHSTDIGTLNINENSKTNLQTNKNDDNNDSLDNNNKSNNTISPTRLQRDNSDNNYTDNERIENIAKHTGYTVEQVTNIIKYYVGDIRSKLMMKT